MARCTAGPTNWFIYIYSYMEHRLAVILFHLPLGHVEQPALPPSLESSSPISGIYIYYKNDVLTVHVHVPNA